MPITLYELAGADPEIRFSPFCWRTRFALAHKGLAFEGVPWRLTEKDRIAFSGGTTVPVIIDNGKTVADSWAIAEYLEQTYPDRPSLFGGSAGRAHARFINAWADTVLQPPVIRLIACDLLAMIDAGDKAYFRESREKRFGVTLEELAADRDERVDAWRALLAPVRRVLERQQWLGGEVPDYADYIVLGALQWPRCASRFELLKPDDSVAAWQQRGMALFGGLGDRAKTV